MAARVSLAVARAYATEETRWTYEEIVPLRRKKNRKMTTNP
jgi:hypothetical protein